MSTHACRFDNKKKNYYSHLHIKKNIRIQSILIISITFHFLAKKKRKKASDKIPFLSLRVFRNICNIKSHFRLRLTYVIICVMWRQHMLSLTSSLIVLFVLLLALLSFIVAYKSDSSENYLRSRLFSRLSSLPFVRHSLASLSDPLQKPTVFLCLIKHLRASWWFIGEKKNTTTIVER